MVIASLVIGHMVIRHSERSFLLHAPACRAMLGRDRFQIHIVHFALGLLNIHSAVQKRSL
jgi:hypothetical protein